MPTSTQPPLGSFDQRVLATIGNDFDLYDRCGYPTKEAVDKITAMFKADPSRLGEFKQRVWDDYGLRQDVHSALKVIRRSLMN